MKSKIAGKNISRAEILNVSPNGIWLIVKDREYFLPYENFPWFKDKKISEIFNLKLLHNRHLYWPELDIDLDLESLKNTEHYPLVYR